MYNTNTMIAVLDNLRSAQNVGSIIRTCDALDIKEIYLCGITPDQKNKKVLKTSLGAEKNIIIHVMPSAQAAIEEVRTKDFKIIGLEIAPDSIDIDKFNDSGDFALVVGNEVSGLSREILEICDYILQIPMQGIKESLNVAVAFGIASHVVINQSTCRSEQKE
jgi:23S rRNA (guanosine2251-2'-O)-methyltransferase